MAAAENNLMQAAKELPELGRRFEEFKGLVGD